MHVCLLAPRWNKMVNSYPPLGLAYLAAFLEREGHRVTVYDFGLEPNGSLAQDVAEVAACAPDLIGITAMSSNYHSALEMARALKSATPAPIVVGGPHASLFPTDLLQEPCFDYVIYGEGESTICELVRALQEGEGPSRAEALRAILGLCFRAGEEIVQNPPRPLDHDLDRFPFPARHLFQIERYPLYAPDGERMVTVLSSRGCPYNCSYCFKGIMGRGYRQRSVDNILAEIRQVMAAYGARHFYFIDDLFTINKRRLLEFTQRVIDEGLEIRWQCLGRVDRIDAEALGQMYQAGCREIHYGIEAGTQAMLDAIGKQITLEQVRQAVRWTREAGIMVKGYFMLGLPDDTEETMEQTIRFATELDLDEAMFSLTTPFPGTRLWEELCQRHPGTQYNADFSRAYYYSSYTEEIEPFMNLSQVSDKRLSQLIKEAHARFWESKRQHKYVRVLGPTAGTLLWRLSRIPAVRALGRRVIDAGWHRKGQKLRQGGANSWS